jgi:hypothetical protein
MTQVYNSGVVANEIVDALEGASLTLTDAGGHVRDISHFEVTSSDGQKWNVAVSPVRADPGQPVSTPPEWGYTRGVWTLAQLRDILVAKGLDMRDLNPLMRSELEQLLHHHYHADMTVAQCPDCARESG